MLLKREKGNKKAYPTRRALRTKKRQRQISFIDKALICVCVILLFWLTLGPFGLWRLYRLNDLTQQLHIEAQAILEKNRQLKQEIRRLKVDKTFQEKVVRQKLGWIRDNELLYIFHK